MYIVTATSDDYAKHLGVMLTSLLENQEETTDIKIFIIHGNISSKNKHKLERVLGRFNLQHNFISVSEKISDFFGNYKTDHLSQETYYKVIIPELLSRGVSKVLYIDCDILVRGDLTNLWNSNISDFFLGAVKEFGIKKKWKELIMPVGTTSYFNAGVLLINLQKWRDHNISTQVIQYTKDNYSNFHCADQDALNAVLYDKWLKLDPKWNYTTGIRKRKNIDDPAIIHFTGHLNKPWDTESPFNQEYLKYLNASQWEQDY